MHLESFPWISKAQKFSGEKFVDLNRGMPTREFLAWKQIELHNRYRATDNDGFVHLIQNPDAWDWKVIGATIHFIRPEPEPTGKKRTDTEKPKPWMNR